MHSRIKRLQIREKTLLGNGIKRNKVYDQNKLLFFQFLLDWGLPRTFLAVLAKTHTGALLRLLSSFISIAFLLDTLFLAMFLT